jgi:beta-hydroxyacyl-ACP dehydratase FabZ
VADPEKHVVFNINDILRILPHRYPFLLVDRVLELKPDQRIVALKNVTVNEPFFQGHFPGAPVMPGVLVLEAMAQAGGIMLYNNMEQPETKLMYFTGIQNAKFRRPVIPGDQLLIEMELLNRRSHFGKMSGRASVEGRVVAEATVQFAIVSYPGK